MQWKRFGFAVISGLSVVVCLADTHWMGNSNVDSTDWHDTANWWWNAGNRVFGGARVDDINAEHTTVAFTNAVEITCGLWVENDSKPDIVWTTGADADEDAGLFINRGSNQNLTIGTGKHGGLTILDGFYKTAGETWISQGSANSFLRVSGGQLTSGSYLCLGYDSSGISQLFVDGTGHVRVTGGKFICGRKCPSSAFKISKEGLLETTVDTIITEVSGSTEIVVEGGRLDLGGTVKASSGTGTSSLLKITDGDVRFGGKALVGAGTDSVAQIEMSGGTFDTDNEFVLCTGTDSTSSMTLSGGTFTPKKFWVGSTYNNTSNGCNATFTMSGGTLTTDNDQDIVVGGNENANGRFIMQSGVIRCGKTFYIAWRGNGVVEMSGGDIYIKPNNKLALTGTDQSQSASLTMTGGTIHTDIIDETNMTGLRELVVNGGAFAPVTDQSDWLSGGTIQVGANGLVVNTDGFTAKLNATLVPVAPEVEEGEEEPTPGTVHVIKTGAGYLRLGSTSADAIDLLTVNAGAYLVTKGDTVPVQFELVENGKLAVDVSAVTEVGLHDLVTLPAAMAEMKFTTDNVELVGLDGNPQVSYTVVDGVLKADISVIERLVWNGDNQDWNTVDAWKGEVSGGTFTFAEGDKVALVAAEDEERTVLVSGEVKPGALRVKGAGVSRIKGNGTITVAEIVNEGNLHLASDETLVLNAKLENNGEATGVTTFESGTIEIPSSVHQDTVIAEDATVVRKNAEWIPSTAISGTGELRIENCKMRVNAMARLKNFTGTITLAEGAVLAGETELHAENASQGYYGFGESTIKLAGGKIDNFSNGGTNNDHVRNLMAVDGTVSEIYNYRSRGGWHGCNVNINGTISGGGTVKFYSNDRNVTFNDDFAGFSGRLEMDGVNYKFNKSIKGGTFVLNTGANIVNENNKIASISIEDGVTWIANNEDDYALTVAVGATVGSNGSGVLNAVNFEQGAKFRFTANGALSDTHTEYEGITVGSYSGLPVIDLPEEATNSFTGKWICVWRENPAVEEGGASTYTLVAKWRKAGFTILIK